MYYTYTNTGCPKSWYEIKALSGQLLQDAIFAKFLIMQVCR